MILLYIHLKDKYSNSVFIFPLIFTFASKLKNEYYQYIHKYFESCYFVVLIIFPLANYVCWYTHLLFWKSDIIYFGHNVTKNNLLL